MSILEQTLYKNKNHSQRSNWGINLGTIKTANPLNCGKCGSRNLKYKRGKKQGSLFAHCQNQDCNHAFKVNAKLADHLQHLIEPDPPPEKHPCRQCGRLAEAIDQWYVQCWNCGGLITRYFGGEVDE